MSPGYCYFIGITLGDAAVSLHFVDLARELVDRGHRVVLLTDQQRGSLEDREGNPAIWSWPSRRPTHLRDARFFTTLVRRLRPDCLVANFSSVSMMLSLGRLWSVPVRVAWYHTPSGMIDLEATNPAQRVMLSLRRRRRRWIYGAATHLAAVSEAARQDLVATFRVDPSRTIVQHNAIADPLEEFADLGAAGMTRERLICAGRLIPVKGQETLLRAVAVLAPTHPHLRIELVGTGESRPRYVGLAHELGIADRCHFAGELSRSQVLAKMAGAAAVVVPSFDEGCPMVVIEALAVGTPIVASAVGGIPEMVRDGEEGVLLRPGDPEALAVGIERLLDDPDARAVMARRARARFLAQFERTAAVARQADWLEDIAAEARRSTAHPVVPHQPR